MREVILVIAGVSAGMITEDAIAIVEGTRP